MKNVKDLKGGEKRMNKMSEYIRKLVAQGFSLEGASVLARRGFKMLVLGSLLAILTMVVVCGKNSVTQPVVTAPDSIIQKLTLNTAPAPNAETQIWTHKGDTQFRMYVVSSTEEYVITGIRIDGSDYWYAMQMTMVTYKMLVAECTDQLLIAGQ